jgi:hypothetical protein
VISWQENLLEGEMPPDWMWPYQDELEVWFEEVDRKRKEKNNPGGEDAEGDSMMQNEFSRGRR